MNLGQLGVSRQVCGNEGDDIAIKLNEGVQHEATALLGFDVHPAVSRSKQEIIGPDLLEQQEDRFGDRVRQLPLLPPEPPTAIDTRSVRKRRMASIRLPQ